MFPPPNRLLKKAASFVLSSSKSSAGTAASPLGGAHERGAPYSSHRAPQRYAPVSTRLRLAGQPFEQPAMLLEPLMTSSSSSSINPGKAGVHHDPWNFSGGKRIGPRKTPLVSTASSPPLIQWLLRHLLPGPDTPLVAHRRNERRGTANIAKIGILAFQTLNVRSFTMARNEKHV
jgi:hypothetical protein